ncbi:MAG TPA: hemerythrin family protein [Anaeromyxobacteraceae bacterium]|nr:hemerythrin family protein [Anaeromyxobacteraceae bacterium]
MEPADWRADLETGLGEVDQEHQLQVRLVEALREAIEAGRDRAVVDELLQRLEDTSNVHFMSEELLMRLHAWERYEPHTEEHRQLMEELRGLRRRFERGADAELALAVGQLQAWLAGHVRGMDRSFARYVSRGGLGAR